MFNSIEHAFPKSTQNQGLICISLKQQSKGTICLSIKDNGIGLPADFVIEDAESLGLQLVSTLVEQLDGELQLERADGTNFQITFSELCYEERV